jgi:hypothetical protein
MYQLNQNSGMLKKYPMDWSRDYTFWHRSLQFAPSSYFPRGKESACMIESPAMEQRCKKQSIRFLFLVAVFMLMATPACVSQEEAQASISEVLASLESEATQSDPVAQSTPASQLLDEGEATSPGLSPNEPMVLNPLTGEMVISADRLERRPILIKITLYPRNNRPQWGLSRADIVYEHYTEGGLSRFSALFYGEEAEQVGPIRSARFIDVQLVRMYGALFAYGSADYRVLEQIDASEFAERAIREFPAGCPPLCRIDPTGTNHLVTDTRALMDYYAGEAINLSAPDLQGMQFDPEVPKDGVAAVQLRIDYSIDNFHQWNYVDEAMHYQRSQETGEADPDLATLTDRLTASPIEAANVVILQVPHELYSRTPEIVEIQLFGEGEAVALRDGFAYTVRWIRPFPEGVLYLTFPDGRLYPMKPGKTWFEIVGVSSQIADSSAGAWSVVFDTP